MPAPVRCESWSCASAVQGSGLLALRSRAISTWGVQGNEEEASRGVAEQSHRMSWLLIAVRLLDGGAARARAFVGDPKPTMASHASGVRSTTNIGGQIEADVSAGNRCTAGTALPSRCPTPAPCRVRCRSAGRSTTLCEDIPARTPPESRTPPRRATPGPSMGCTMRWPMLILMALTSGLAFADGKGVGIVDVLHRSQQSHLHAMTPAVSTSSTALVVRGSFEALASALGTHPGTLRRVAALRSIETDADGGH